MAEAEDKILETPEQSDNIPDEDEWIQKIKELFPDDFHLMKDSDLRRIIRGYAGEKKRLEETVDHVKVWLKFLKEHRIADIGFRPMEDQEMYKNMQQWAQFTVHGEDKYNHPVMYEKLSNYKCDMIEQNLDKALLYRLRVFSQMWNKKHQNEKKYGKMIYKQINVFDMKGMGVFQANKFKETIKKIIAFEGDAFPETVYKMYFINSDWKFKWAWNIISYFVHKETQKKIQILGTNYLEKLLEDVDISQIPKEFDGECEAPIVWGETWFNEPAEEQFPDLLKESEDKKPVANAPAKVEEENTI